MAWEAVKDMKAAILLGIASCLGVGSGVFITYGLLEMIGFSSIGPVAGMIF